MASIVVAEVTTSPPSKYKAHQNPIWRERANFLIHAEIYEDERLWGYEQLSARKITDDTFELCCIPTHVYGFALGDWVQALAEEDRRYVVKRVVKPSGHLTFRAWFGDTKEPWDAVIEQLSSMGALLEGASPHLLGIDVNGEDEAKRMADFLGQCEQQGKLTYETGNAAK